MGARKGGAAFALAPRGLTPLHPCPNPRWAWESDDRDWNDIFYLQAGEPQGLCKEGPSGVFSREWSEGTAVLDCNKWTASLPFAALPHD